MDPAGWTLSLTFRRQLEVGDAAQWCFAPGECVAAEPIVPLALVLVTGFVTFVVAVALVHVEDAWPLLEEERERTRTERAAFEAFARRVAALDATTPEPSISSVGPVPALKRRSADARLERVKEAYRETVMSVPHYEEEYDEPLEVHMTAELGAEVAAAVSEGSALTPQLKTALARTSAEAVTTRDDLLERLDREANALEETESELTAVDAELDRLTIADAQAWGFGRLLDAWNRLREAEDRCRTALTRRQEFVADTGDRTGDAPSIQEYLYRPLEVNYPALAAGTDLMERIDEARRDVEAALARRP